MVEHRDNGANSSNTNGRHTMVDGNRVDGVLTTVFLVSEVVALTYYTCSLSRKKYCIPLRRVGLTIPIILF